jgi:CHAT domain
MLMFGQRAGQAIAEPEGYVAVELRLFPRDEQGTPAELSMPGVRRDFPRVRVQLATEALSALATKPRDYGEALGKQLFEETQLGKQLDELRAALDAKGARWRFRVRLEDPPLEALRWERLCIHENGSWAPIGSAADRPFSRYVPVTDWKMATPIVERPITVLLVYASPANLGKLRLPPIPAAERDAIRQAIKGSALDQVQVEELSSDAHVRPTLAALREALTRGPAIVHVLCHGTSGKAGSALVLEKDNGDAHAVPAVSLCDAVRGAATPPHLMVLSACESATPTAAAGFVSLGSLMACEFIDAVLAMSGAVSVDTARIFCAHFYKRLFAHGVLDRAVNEARAVVRDSIDWGLPVLFARMRDCQLLDFAPARVDTEYLGISNRVMRAAGVARAFGEENQVDREVIGSVNALITELEKSHKVLVGVTGDFRRTGSDPATFPKQFEAFRADFKVYYDNKTWTEERTKCHKVNDLKQPPMMRLFERSLAKEEFKQLEQDLDRLGDLDDDIIRHLATFLESMDHEVEAINKLLRSGSVPDAIVKKVAFEDQISPTFRRSKELLAEISERSHAVRAA